MDTIIYNLNRQYDEGMEAAARVIRSGGVVAFPTETVYGLGADALNAAACERIFKAKGRPSDNPLIVHVCSPEMADDICNFRRASEFLERFWPGPLSAVLEKKDCVPFEVTAGLNTVAVRMPANTCALSLIRKSGRPIAAPSANRSGAPSPTRASHVYNDLNGLIPIILDGGPCGVGVESTVCDFTGPHPVILRPGAVTLDMLKELDPKSSVHEGAYIEGAPPSPGMKYAHYAPKAALTLVSGPDEEVAEYIKKNATNDLKKNNKSVILCYDDTLRRYTGFDTVTLGSRGDLETVARSLFNALRELDRLGAKTAYVEGVPGAGLGMAIMNRLKKACAGRLVVLKEDPTIR